MFSTMRQIEVNNEFGKIYVKVRVLIDFWKE